MIKPRVDKLLDRTDSHYAAVVVAAKRARQLNSYYRALGEGSYEEYTPPMVETAVGQLPDDRARGAGGGEDRLPLPRLRRRGRRAMARILLGVSGGIAAYKALELAAARDPRRARRPRR